MSCCRSDFPSPAFSSVALGRTWKGERVSKLCRCNKCQGAASGARRSPRRPTSTGTACEGKARHLGLLEKRRRRKSHAALRRSAVHKEIRRGARVATVGRPPQPAKTSQATIALHAKRKGNPAATAFASPIARRRSRPARSGLFRAGGSAGGPHLAAAGPRSPAPLGSRLARTEG